MRAVFKYSRSAHQSGGVRRRLIGAYNRELAKLMASVFRELGTEHTLVVRNSDGMDEISLAAPTHVFNCATAISPEYEIDTTTRCPRRRTTVWKVAMRKNNAAIASKFSTVAKPARRDVVVMNAAAGIYVAGKTDSLATAADLARHSLDSGAALANWKPSAN